MSYLFLWRSSNLHCKKNWFFLLWNVVKRWNLLKKLVKKTLKISQRDWNLVEKKDRHFKLQSTLWWLVQSFFVKVNQIAQRIDVACMLNSFCIPRRKRNKQQKSMCVCVLLLPMLKWKKKFLCFRVCFHYKHTNLPTFSFEISHINIELNTHMQCRSTSTIAVRKR